mgnify:CR=1 FL=1
MKKLFYYKEINEINKKKVLKSLDHNHFVILRDLIDPLIVKKILKNIKKKFKPQNDSIRKEKDYKLVRSNYQRFMFGMSGGVKGALKTNPRYFRVFYNPMWCRDIYNARQIFYKLTEIQNFFYGLPLDYGKYEKKTKHNLFVASRFQHYPSGGGFLATHKDDAAIKTAKRIGINLYYNILLIMTKKGKDYKDGGGFVIKNNKIVSYEDLAQVGDIVIYNSKTLHGVLDIDRNKLPDIKSSEGRYVGLTTLFKW